VNRPVVRGESGGRNAVAVDIVQTIIVAAI
jgi:hypothetical protein